MSRLYLIIGLVIFLSTFIVLSWSIFCPCPPKFFFEKLGWARVSQDKWAYPVRNSISNGAYGQLPLSQELVYPGHNSVFIPKIGLNIPIVFTQSQDPKDISQALDQGIVHWPETAYPGEDGNMVLVGHSSSYFWQKTPYGQIFARLDKLAAGDMMIIFYGQKRYSYQIKEVKVVPTKSIKILPEESDLTLITCWPPGTTWQRLVVKAENSSL